MTTSRQMTACATAALGVATLGLPTSASAFESGFPGWAQQPGIILGASAGTPGPGIYMFNQLMTTQSTIVGPAAPNVGGKPTQVHLASEATGFLFVPGWTFLGATYDAVIVQPVSMVDVGAPANQQKSGFHNTYIVPAELSWKLGDSGFVVKTGLGMYVPDGSTTGTSGLGSAVAGHDAQKYRRAVVGWTFSTGHLGPGCRTVAVTVPPVADSIVRR